MMPSEAVGAPKSCGTPPAARCLLPSQVGKDDDAYAHGWHVIGAGRARAAAAQPAEGGGSPAGLRAAAQLVEGGGRPSAFLMARAWASTAASAALWVLVNDRRLASDADRASCPVREILL